MTSPTEGLWSLAQGVAIHRFPIDLHLRNAHISQSAPYPYNKTTGLPHIIRSEVSELDQILLNVHQSSCPFYDQLRAPFLNGHYSASSVLRTQPPSLSLAIFQLPCASTLTGLPVLSLLPSYMHAKINTPADIAQCACRSLPRLPTAFPCETEGRLPHCKFRDLLNLHYPAFPSQNLGVTSIQTEF